MTRVALLACLLVLGAPFLAAIRLPVDANSGSVAKSLRLKSDSSKGQAGALGSHHLAVAPGPAGASEVYAVGVTMFEVVSRLGETMRTLLWYPANGTAIGAGQPMYKYLGKVRSQMAYDGARHARGAFPLVVISHGAGSSPEHHFLQAESFAHQGYVVAALTHAGDNLWNATFKSKVIVNALLRPRDISAVIDTLQAAAGGGGVGAGAEWGLLASPPRAPPLARLAQMIDFSRGVAVVGHSMGGIAAMSLAGQGPSCREMEVQFSAGGSCGGLPPDWSAPGGGALDPRVSAVVPMDPAPLRQLPLRSGVASPPAFFLSGEQCISSRTQWGFRNETEQYYQAWPRRASRALAVSKRSRHGSFTNMCVLAGYGLLPEEATRGAEMARWCRTGEAAPQPDNLQVLTVVQELSLAFIDAVLKRPARWQEIESGEVLSPEYFNFLVRYDVSIGGDGGVSAQ